MSRSSSMVALALALLIAGTAAAQVLPGRRQPSDRNPRNVPAQQTQQDRAAPQTDRAYQQRPWQADEILAAWLTFDNQNEIELARLAQQRAENKDVKEFAKRMIEDHQQLVDKLAGFTSGSRQSSRQESPIRDNQTAAQGAAAGRPPVDAGRAAARDFQNPQQAQNPQPAAAGPRAAQGPQRRIAARPTAEGQIPAHPGMGIDVIGMKQELAQQCLQSAQRELEQKQGSQFDKCFMNAQVMVHMGAVDTMQVFQRHASDQLKQVLDQGIQVASDHLEKAKDLAKRLDSSSDTARRDAPRDSNK